MGIDRYLLGTVIILFLGICMLIPLEVFSKKIAVNNSESISKLIREIYVIKNGNLNYKIKLDTDDEIETIAENINELVDRIKTLNERNTELLNIKRISEIKQLEAQFNPHFLYNTLETIRYSIFLDKKAASDLISLLTRILRYSVSKGSDEVKFSENVEYAKVFLKIYKYRYDKNFN
jgi:sensor histidine kinase YesM